MKAKPLIWVEGLIGCGKSTLAKAMAEAFNFRMMREPVDDNPYLNDFYLDPKAHAFAMQMHLLEVRAGLQDLAGAEVLFGQEYSGVVLDRGLPGDHAFARLHMIYGNMTQRNYDTYRLAYLRRTNQMKAPSLMLYLEVEPDVALRRVKQRARGAESGLTLKYLQDLRDQYTDLLVELQNGDHEWAGHVEVKKIAWNADSAPVMPILSYLQDRFHLQLSPKYQGNPDLRLA